jgi:hypothetical protein
MLREDKCRIYAKLLQLHPRRKRDTLSNLIYELQSRVRKTAKENMLCSKRILWETFFCMFTSPGHFSPFAPNQATLATIGTIDIWEKLAAPLFSSSCHNRKFRKQVCQYRLQFHLTDML